uniref:helix-turn-helix domain-containing protein n=1 Tax=Amycolatopsis sp. CA-096443 TaxID=3239919 RepID=UPI003F495126
MSEARPGAPSPSVTRAMAGAAFRQMRERTADGRALTRAEVTAEFRKSPAWLGGIERGAHLPSARDQHDMLTLYGYPERIPYFEQLRKATYGRKDWWETELFSAAAPPWLDQLLGLESIADTLTTYDAMVPNGLLQLETTARAIISGSERALAADEVARRAALRIARQAVWRDRRGEALPLTVNSIVDQAALERPVGGPDVHREQLLHMAAVAEDIPNVTILVLPTSVGAHPSMEGSFKLFRFPADLGAPGAVYVENRHDSAYYHEAERIEKTAEDLDILAALALDPERSIACIRSLAKEMYP